MFFFTCTIRKNKSKFVKIPDLSDFKRSHIVGARLADASVTKTAELLGIAKSIASKEIIASEKEGKKLLNEAKLWKNTTPKITAELKNHLEKPVSPKTVKRELYKA